MSVKARVSLCVSVSVRVRSKGTVYSSPLARISVVTGWMMQAVPHPNISSRRPSFAAYSRHQRQRRHSPLRLPGCHFQLCIMLEQKHDKVYAGQLQCAICICLRDRDCATDLTLEVCSIQEARDGHIACKLHQRYLLDFLDAQLAL